MLYFHVVTCMAQEKLAKFPVFTVRPALNQPMPDSIQVAFRSGIVNGQTDGQKNIVIRKADSSFYFTFTEQQAISPFEMWIYYPNTVINPDTSVRRYRMQILNTPIYFAQPSDQIEIKVTRGEPIDRLRINGSITFSGERGQRNTRSRDY